ncbi:hypothetical protein AQUCO_04000033v1 [Aquilegia coerulea]|uniref:Protein kinase domain-containing protein n=1 Tax=Aquilegia coerulea TaxID=218851 RepID=A0A2G5CR69_AQUCA|nr:hypothetical protein AQUCO_04000033v1 [Aquilegia coerulea]PIA33691.1 hypothetical protein AQUCO_04000033v1 [Aquilegia coerulea]
MLNHFMLSSSTTMLYSYSHLFLVISVSLFFFFSDTQQLETSQTQLLYQLRKQLEYPKPLEVWNNYNGDLCYSPYSTQVIVTCENNSIIELQIVGDILSRISEFDGFPIFNQTLSESFSIDSFVTTLSRLTSLKFLSLVSLGIWGPLPDKIHQLSSLESLDLSSNYLHGSIPSRISAMVKLQVLRLDNNFFNDTVPDWFDSLSNLTILSLKSNHLKGAIPYSICRVKTLNELGASYNQISGVLPDLSNLTSLSVLDLRENQIGSKLPIMPKGLITVLLSKNSFFGEIPQQFTELNQLQHLDLSFNFLQGTLPAALFTLPNISYLNMASNMLIGSLPKNLACSSALSFVDISNNKLTGGLPSCFSSHKKIVKFGGNCLSIEAHGQNLESYCRIKREKSDPGGKFVGLLIGVIGGIVFILVLLSILVIFLHRRCCRRETSVQRLLPKEVQDILPTGLSPEFLASARFISQTTKLGGQDLLKYRLFSIDELKEATNNFDESTCIGEGSLGKVFKGRLESGAYVAIRCLSLLRRDSLRNVKHQLDLLSKLHHPHLVCLLGHCIDIDEQDIFSINRVFLIYEYMSNGNFHTHLSESLEKVPEWSDRLSVLIGTAKAVHYLHTGISPGFFDNRLRANSILIDEHRIAKLSDYGLSIIIEEINRLEVRLFPLKWHIGSLFVQVMCLIYTLIGL